MTKVTYEVQDKDQGWLGPVSEGTQAVAPKGIVGLDVTVDDPHLQVAYQAYYNGQWLPEEKDGGKIGDGSTVFRAVRILISPRRGSQHIHYQALDNLFQQFDATDDRTAGQTIANNGADGLRTLEINLSST
jgi:hypothetical protein